MQNEPGIPQRCSIFPGRAPQPPRPSRRWGAAAALVVLAAVLALVLPEAAQAQPAQTLISNFGQPVRTGESGASITSGFDLGQTFTTGPNPGGYSLDSIRARFTTVNILPTEVKASIWTTTNSPTPNDAPATAVGGPLVKQFDLMNPADITTVGDKTFTAPPNTNTKLDPLTTYAVVFETTDGNIEMGLANSRAEDAGGAPDWHIIDFRNLGLFLFSLSWSIPTDPYPLRIEVKGTILVPPVASPDEPQYLRATVGHAQVVLSWIAPASAGGTAITKYQYRYSAGSTVDASATWTDVPVGDVPVGADTDVDNETTVTVTGLTNGTQYAFEVRAVNSLGAGTAATVKATPRLTLTITWDEQAARSQPSFTVTFTFSEAVEDFDAEDWRRHRVFAHAATEANFQMISATTYTIEVTPLAGEGHVNIYVSENVAQAVNRTDGNSLTVEVIPLLPRVTGTSTSTDATLSALTLEDASDGSAITISPIFAAGTTSYMASVDNDVDEITITPTVNESNATVEYLDSSDTEITDADGVKTGQQVSLSEGTNTIKVKVTAEDTTTTNPYTVVVTRATVVPGAANVLVSNAGQSSNSSNNSSVDRAQAFTTVAGATLSSVEIISSDPAGDDLAVSLCTTNSSGYPTSSCTALTAPASFAAGTLVFTDPASTTLAANTTYSLLLVSPGNDFLNLSATTSDAEDTGGAAGWTIANAYNSKSGTVWVTTASNSSFLITIKGTLGTTTPNTAPMGAPTITGTAQVGETLTAVTTGITDADGLTSPGYTYQWIRVNGSEADIAGANSSTYTLDAADLDKTIKVKVSFTDDASNAETLTSAATVTVTAATTDETTTMPPPTRPTVASGRRSPPSTPPPPPSDVVGYLENPGAASFQSGIGVISGWVCDADEVEITLNGEPQEAAYGTERLDTEAVCGDSDNGFGLLFNWNLLGDGEHEVVALVDGVELDRATVTVTTLGAEFLRDVTGTCTAADFPTGDETVTLAWQQTQQSFVIVDGPAPAGPTNRMGTPGMGYLENPGPNSFQSGIGVLSGWACEGEEVVIEMNGAPQPAAYGTERLDTLEMCGDTANGFGLLFNWNLLGEGEHEVVAFVDGEELGRATVRVTTLGAEFVLGAEGECVVEDFPMPGETVTLEWQQNSQNFVITDVE